MSALWRDGPTVSRSATPVVPELGSVTVTPSENAASSVDHSVARFGNAAWQAASAAQRGEQQVERLLAAGRHELQHGDVERCRAVHDRDPHMARVLAQVVLRELTAVGSAVQVDRVVSERRPDRVKVVGGDAARVHARVGIEPREAVFAQAARRASASASDSPVVSGMGGQAQRVRRAGAALVDENDVVGGVDVGVRAREPGEERRARVARAAGEGEQRVRLRRRRRRPGPRQPGARPGDPTESTDPRAPAAFRRGPERRPLRGPRR